MFTVIGLFINDDLHHADERILPARADVLDEILAGFFQVSVLLSQYLIDAIETI